MSELADAQAGDELFGLPPEEFVAARDDLARRLRREGEADAAKQVKALRRPPLSAWAVNQLARGQGDGLGPLLAAGERLRAAHQAALAGEGAAELRAAAKAERDAVAGLVRSAMELLGAAGHPTPDATRDRVASVVGWPASRSSSRAVSTRPATASRSALAADRSWAAPSPARAAWWAARSRSPAASRGPSARPGSRARRLTVQADSDGRRSALTRLAASASPSRRSRRASSSLAATNSSGGSPNSSSPACAAASTLTSSSHSLPPASPHG